MRNRMMAVLPLALAMATTACSHEGKGEQDGKADSGHMEVGLRSRQPWNTFPPSATLDAGPSAVEAPAL